MPLRAPTIYFLQREDGLIKIGFTARNAKRRQSEVQVGCPEKLCLLAEAAGTRDQEYALHKLFADARERGEWFHPVPELMDLISAVAIDETSLDGYVS